jgi:hypothetical protein
MPPRLVEGRISAHQRLDCRQQVFTPDTDGWREILYQHVKRPATASVVPLEPARGGQPTSHRPPRHIPTDLDDECLNCLSSSHRVPTCKLTQRCLQCKGFRHVARDCRWPRHAGNRISSDHALVHSVGPANLGGSCGHGGATMTPRHPPWMVGADQGRGDASVVGIVGGRLSLHIQHRHPPRLLPKLCLGAPPSRRYRDGNGCCHQGWPSAAWLLGGGTHALPP